MALLYLIDMIMTSSSIYSVTSIYLPKNSRNVNYVSYYAAFHHRRSFDFSFSKHFCITIILVKGFSPKNGKSESDDQTREVHAVNTLDLMDWIPERLGVSTFKFALAIMRGFVACAVSLPPKICTGSNNLIAEKYFCFVYFSLR